MYFDVNVVDWSRTKNEHGIPSTDHQVCEWHILDKDIKARLLYVRINIRPLSTAQISVDIWSTNFVVSSYCYATCADAVTSGNIPVTYMTVLSTMDPESTALSQCLFDLRAALAFNVGPEARRLTFSKIWQHFSLLSYRGPPSVSPWSVQRLRPVCHLISHRVSTSRRNVTFI